MQPPLLRAPGEGLGVSAAGPEPLAFSTGLRTASVLTAEPLRAGRSHGQLRGPCSHQRQQHRPLHQVQGQRHEAKPRTGSLFGRHCPRLGGTARAAAPGLGSPFDEAKSPRIYHNNKLIFKKGRCHLERRAASCNRVPPPRPARSAYPETAVWGRDT